MVHTRSKGKNKKVLVGLKSFWDEIRKRDYKNVEGLKAQITKKDYDYMLNVLPPLRWKNDTFYMKEFLSGDLTTKVTKKNGKYYAEVVDYKKEFPSLSKKEYLEERFG